MECINLVVPLTTPFFFVVKPTLKDPVVVPCTVTVFLYNFRIPAVNLIPTQGNEITADLGGKFQVISEMELTSASASRP